MYRATLALAASLLVSTSALAVSLSDIDAGDAYYLNEFGSNSKVLVVRVDPPANRVKIRREDGTTEWTSPDRLLTSEESTGAEVKEAIGWGALLIAGACALSEDCRKAATESDTPKSNAPSH
jgi:hypothetical protein